MNKPAPVTKRLPGISVDRDGKYFYYDAKRKKAYFIKPEDLKMAEVLAYRPYIAVSVGVVLYSILQGNWIFYLVSSVVLYGLMEWYTQTKMKARCRLVNNYQKVILKEKESPQKKRNLLIKTIAYLVCAGLLTYTIVLEGNEGASLAVLVGMIGVCLVGALQNLLALIKG